MSQYFKRIRRLTIALIVSGVCNIILLSLFLFWVLREAPPAPYCSLKPAEQQEQQTPLAIESSNSDMVQALAAFPYQELVSQLENVQLVENGYTLRDLALGTLVTFHHFDIHRALQGHSFPKQERLIGNLITAYPNLMDQQYQAIVHFTRTEKWPMTAQGLFKLLEEGETDPTLKDAFTLTNEFLAVEMLFNRSNAQSNKDEIIQLLLEGPWDTLEVFAEQQRVLQDLSPARRQMFLLHYLENESPTAAYLLLKTDGTFATQKLDDSHVLLMLSLMQEPTSDSENFALALIASPRSDAVLQQATNTLYNYIGEQPPTPPKPEIYEVQPGDSLWKIAKHLNVSLDELMEHNEIEETDFIQPGMTLKIPNNS